MFKLAIGKKSLLFGVHQFLWHPYTVYRAWKHLYGTPNFKELVCIFIHDWGYWICTDIDGETGIRHPELGAKIAGKLFGQKYYELVLYHSRYCAKEAGQSPSKLCWADKLSIRYEPRWWYLFRARLSGEIKEFRKNAVDYIPFEAKDSEWFEWLKVNFIKVSSDNTIK